jgi:predicted HTH transcriptional regulator
MMEDIYQKLAIGEGENLEYKFEINSGRKIASTISAFSNTSGGSLLIGVKDNGTVAGVRIEEELYVLDAAAKLYCKPEVTLQLKRWDIKGKIVLEAYVPMSETKPVFAEVESGVLRAYIRLGSSNILANAVNLQLWKTAVNKDKPKVFTEKQLTVISLFKTYKWLNLNQISRKSKLPRNIVIITLADLIRWNIVEAALNQGGGFVYLLADN